MFQMYIRRLSLSNMPYGYIHFSIVPKSISFNDIFKIKIARWDDRRFLQKKVFLWMDIMQNIPSFTIKLSSLHRPLTKIMQLKLKVLKSASNNVSMFIFLPLEEVVNPNIMLNRHKKCPKVLEDLLYLNNFLHWQKLFLRG